MAESIKLYGLGEVVPNPRWRTPPHFHTLHHELIVVVGGSMLLKTHHGDRMASSGDLLFYESGLVHEEISQAHDPVHTFFIGFQVRKMLPSIPLVLKDSTNRISQLISWLIRDHQRGRPLTDCLPLVEVIVRELLWLSSRPVDPWLESVVSYLRTHFAHSISLADVAKAAGMSRFAFIRKFKRLTGHTPMAELRALRLQNARSLILSSGLPLKSIAPAVGLGDEYQLSKLFRRHFGISPREMRARPA